MHFLYVLHSVAFNKIYIGETSDLKARLVAHNHPGNKGWTKKFQPWIVLYTEEFKTRSEALKREKELKSFRGRKWIKTTFLKSS